MSVLVGKYTTPSTEARRRGRHRWEVIFVCLLISTATVASYGTRRYFSHSLLPTDPQRASPPRRNPAYLIKAEHGAVASENELCSNLGVQILKDGGNAVDSAVGTTFCIGVVNMFS
jgi:gamma-glutamyltranspeptidase/glutathione hydrolase/leukotriene-C4 hydrolase